MLEEHLSIHLKNLLSIFGKFGQTIELTKYILNGVNAKI